MAEFKYVIIRRGSFEFPVIFPDKLAHDDMAVYVRALANELGETMPPAEIVSAGFLSNWRAVVDDIQRSETLNMGPRSQDQHLINSFRYGHGII